MGAESNKAATWGEESGSSGTRGSVLLFVLFAALITAVSVQALSTVVLCATNTLLAEREGRSALGQQDQGLNELRSGALTNWQPIPWSPFQGKDSSTSGNMQGALIELPGYNGAAMEAVVRQELEVSTLTASALVEQGRDGLDLPFAAVVGARVKARSGRDQPWLWSNFESWSGCASESECREVASAWLLESHVEAPVADNCEILPLAEHWCLDEGWRQVLASPGGSQTTGLAVEASAGANVIGVGRTFLIQGRSGGSISFPREVLQPEEGSGYFLIVLTGGANLDARYLGLVRGVIVVDEGSALLDGTTVCGAVIVTESVDVGATGTVVFCSSALRWATDQSLRRVRLVPGSRWEQSGD